MFQKKIIYETKWVAKDKLKDYPHGWGFDAPFVEYPQDMDPAIVNNAARDYVI